MRQFTIGLVLLVAALHTVFLVLEMFLWTHPIGRRVFATSEEFAASTRALAANQGLYNGFLAAGLMWAAYRGATDGHAANAIAVFFLGCVVVAGLFGAATVNYRIALIQALPAAIALGAVLAR